MDSIRNARPPLIPGNINLWARPKIQAPEGGISTLRSISVGMDGKTYLIPTVSADGSRILTTEEAVEQFRQSGQHLGVFETPEDADLAGRQLHLQQAGLKIQNTPQRGLPPRPKMR